MSNTPAYTDYPAYPSERRHHIRRQLSGLAYLDIGPDNGGIALNLSEEGMAFQAVGPLDSWTSVSLRIQVPHSRMRIEIPAQIVWLSESNRQAGVRFVDVPPEGRTQIEEWLRSQNLPNAPSEGTLAQREVASDPQRKQEAIREPRKDKWLSLMAQFGVPESAGQTQPRKVEILEKCSHSLSEQETAATIPAPEFALGKLGGSEEPPNGAPRPGEVHPQSAPDQLRIEPPKSGPDGQPNGPNSVYTATTVPTYLRTDRKVVRDWRIPTSPTMAPTVPETSVRPPTSAEPSGSGIDLKTNPAPDAASTLRAAFVATKRSRARNWVVVAVLFALFSFLCFGIGIWVGSLGTPVPSVQTPTPQATLAPVTGPDTSGSNRLKANELASAVPSKTNPDHARGNSAPENRKRKLALPTSSPPVLPVQQDVQSTATNQSLTPLTATKPLESSSSPAPVPVETAAAIPATRIVAGRTLRPTDRFNPCHLSYRVDPAYPIEAQQKRIEGAVKLHQVIGADGSVQSVKLISGPPLLAPAALEAAKYWRYFPALLNGQPIETEQDIEIDFHLPR
jgi:TonB family protein